MRKQALGVVLAAGLAAPAASGGAAAPPASLPFKLKSHIEIEAPLNGRLVKGLLDSGAPLSVLDAAYARSREIKLTPALARALPNRGRVKVNGVMVDTALARLEIGSARVSELVALSDLSTLQSHLPGPMILGGELFRQWVVELDFDAQRLSLHPRRGFKPPAGAPRLAVGRRDGHYRIPIKVEGAAPVQAVLDLGNAGHLQFSRAYAQRTGLLDGRPTRGYEYAGLNTRGEGVAFRLKTLQLGAAALSEVPGVAVETSDEVMGDEPANIGLGVLSRFHLWLDLGGGQMWLSPRQNLAAPFCTSTFGFYLRRQTDGLRVTELDAGCPAQAAGLAPGDLITASGAVTDPLAVRQLIREADGPMAFSLSDGRKVTLDKPI